MLGKCANIKYSYCSLYHDRAISNHMFYKFKIILLIKSRDHIRVPSEEENTTNNLIRLVGGENALFENIAQLILL